MDPRFREDDKDPAFARMTGRRFDAPAAGLMHLLMSPLAYVLSNMKSPTVYLLASARRGTLYVGVTSDLVKRMWQHREGVTQGFTKRYDVKTLVWYEQHHTMAQAIIREKSIKKWARLWKLELIESTNPEWRDLWSDITGH